MSARKRGISAGRLAGRAPERGAPRVARTAGFDARPAPTARATSAHVHLRDGTVAHRPGRAGPHQPSGGADERVEALVAHCGTRCPWVDALGEERLAAPD